jgi:poly-gamma-glutamate capsule biosynthesis protein CapA/YwtB (metallophosphatase superfamily)
MGVYLKSVCKGFSCRHLLLSFAVAVILAVTIGTARPRPVTLVFVGDVMLGRGVAAALNGEWAAAFRDVRPWLADADVALANLESPLTGAPFSGGRFDLRAPPEAVEALTSAGFGVVSLANNHALDGGQAGLAETLDALQRGGIVAVRDSGLAAKDASGSREGLVLPIRNLRIAVLAFLDGGGPLDTERVAWAAAEADLVVVLVHWGAEYYPVTARQRALARELVSAGADLIVGHGPHVLQPIGDMDGGLVAYSLGNFVFDQPFRDTRQGAILRVTVGQEGVMAVEAMPTAIENGRVYPAARQDATSILERLHLPTIPGPKGWPVASAP